jgi:hypothetical protein
LPVLAYTQLLVPPNGANITTWMDTNFDATGTATGTGPSGPWNGNYGIQSKWAWTGSSTDSSGGLGLATAPTAGTPVRLGGGADDQDVAGAGRIHHGLTASYAGGGALGYNNPSTYGSAVLGAPWPVLQSTTVVDLTHVDVVFNVALDPTSAQNVGNYLTTGPSVSAAVLQPGNATVRLTVATMTKGTTYGLSVYNVQDSTLAYTIQPNPGTGTISVPSPTPPTIVSATALDSTHVTVGYSMAMDPTTVTTAAYYYVNNSLSVASVSSANSTSVTLTVSPMTLGTAYTMTIINVQNTLGDAIAAGATTTFAYKVVLVQYPFGAAGFSSTTTGAGLSAVESVTLNNVISRSVTGNNGGYANSMLEWGLAAGFANDATGSTHSFTTTGTSATAGTFIEFGFTVAPGYKANLSSLTFLAARNWGPDFKGMFVESSLTGYSYPGGVLLACTPLSWQPAGGANVAAPYYSSYALDLSGAAFQNISAGTVVTFRIYGYSNNAESWALDTDDITLWGGAAPTGTPPTVAITSPTSPATVTLGNPVTFTAAVTVTNTTPGVTPSGAKFYDGTTLLGVGGSAGGGNYTFQWNTAGQAAGNHNITAVGSDSAGGQATSAITVVNLSTSTPPSVTLTAPASGLIAGQGWLIALSATTTNGTPNVVTGVDFYLNGGTQVGHGTLVSPGVYSYNWDSTLAPFGPNTLLAKVTDGGGLTGSSNGVSIVFRIPGDGNGDNIVDGEDYGIWQNGYNHPGASILTGDYNGDGVVDGEDYGTWQNNYNRTAGLEDVVAASSADVASTPMVGSAAPKLISVTPTASTVALVFDSDVVVGGSAVEVTGLVGGPQAYTAAYDAATKTLTLTFAAGLPADSYTVRVIGSFVVAADGGASLAGDAQAQFSQE